MAQQIYTSIGSKQKSKGSKIIIAILCVAAAILIGLGTVGIIVGSQSDERAQVSEAVAENVQLKQQIDYLNSEVERLNSVVERLGGELASRPEAPVQTATPTPATNRPQGVSPREGM